ncbi:YdcF family protein [Photobacterium ganghwense]|uniref:YdcF family protein n=1 Tax=Photobacterium ganghwense TaxID=320778 RepID=UPI004055A510
MPAIAANAMLNKYLEQASAAFYSPNRAQYPFKDKTESNLAVATYYLYQALNESNPTPLDDKLRCNILLTLANIKTFQGRLSSALSLYAKALPLATRQQRQDILCYLAVWHHATGQQMLSRWYQHQLAENSPSSLYQSNHHAPPAVLLNRSLEILNRCLAQPVRYLTDISEKTPDSSQRITSLPSSSLPCSSLSYSSLPCSSLSYSSWRASSLEASSAHAFVILGHTLNADGSMSARLLNRLALALQLATRYPTSKILVSGGLAKQGMSEAERMAHWLSQHGVSPQRLLVESQSANTIENLRFSLPLLLQAGIRHATLLSTADHVHRAQIVGDILLAQHSNCDSTAAPDAVNIEDTSLEYATSDNHALRMKGSQIHLDHIAVQNQLNRAHPSLPEGQTRLNCYIDALQAMGMPAFRVSIQCD